MPRANYEPAKASRYAIAAYWSKHLHRSTFGSDEESFDLDPDACWACNHDGSGRYPLHRCHLVAAGPGRVQNLVILCQRCHAWQEKRDPDHVLHWIAWCQAESALMPPLWTSRMAPTKELQYFVNELADYGRRHEGGPNAIGTGTWIQIDEIIWNMRDDWHGWDIWEDDETETEAR